MGWFDKQQPEGYEVAGGQLRCEVCEHDKFWYRRAQLNTAVATFFNFDCSNPSADCYVCAGCGYIHWFLPLD